MIFGSEFINTGINLIEDCIHYLNTEFFELFDGGLTFGAIDFSTLTPSVKLEFENWLKGVDEDEEALLQRLIEINSKEFNGKKIKLKFSG